MNRRPWRRLVDLLAREPEQVDHDARWLAWHVPELAAWRWASHPTETTARRLAADAHVTIRWLRKNELGRRVWLCGVVCLDDVPFMMLQNGGREGDDAEASWVFDEARYAEAVRRLSGRARPRVPPLCDLRWRYPDLGNFYGHDLDDVSSSFNHDLCASSDEDPFFARVSYPRSRVLSRMERRDYLARRK